MSRLRLSCARVWDAEPDALLDLVVAAVEASPDNAGGGVPPLRHLAYKQHRRLEDGASAPRARYAPPSVLATRFGQLRSSRVSDGEFRRLQFRLVLVGDGSEPA